MSLDAALALVPVWGPWALGLATFLACLALPIPAWAMMLAGGAFVAGGDLTLPGAVLGAILGAILGDQLGYHLGHAVDTAWGARLRAAPARAKLIGRAEAMARRHGGLGVFLTRWLIAPLGPYVNLIAGAAGMGWLTFTIWAALGELVWVGLYMGAGYLFSDRIEAASAVLGNLSGALAAGAVAVVLGIALYRAVRRDHR